MYHEQRRSRRFNFNNYRDIPGVSVADLLRKHGISRNTFFKWRSKYGGATLAEASA